MLPSRMQIGISFHLPTIGANSNKPIPKRIQAQDAQVNVRDSRSSNTNYLVMIPGNKFKMQSLKQLITGSLINTIYQFQFLLTWLKWFNYIRVICCHSLPAQYQNQASKWQRPLTPNGYLTISKVKLPVSKFQVNVCRMEQLVINHIIQISRSTPN